MISFIVCVTHQVFSACCNRGVWEGQVVLNVCREDKCVNYLLGVYGGKRLLKKNLVADDRTW